MTTTQHGHHQIMARPPCAPAAIRAVLAANADPEIVQQYDSELDAAFEEARKQGDLAPLAQKIHRWWFEAEAWRDPDRHREFLV